eukprot:CAMPEP_0185851610 /NCGR_PEP_ID=MMETSP1354-20130828/10663_1 /TAXON_ID=708628 /ORGANISM="Erythrolobus madagascarensis, Strain CCMP3276" /LENGTH=290 /DNA_ID=CAMNT_0028552635 /DNA_START=74 /DNA_END=946 /DNA_ORIENTATION=+
MDAVEGTLLVMVLEGKNMPDKERFSKQDPYVQLRVAHGVETKRTRTKNEAGKNARWWQGLSFVLNPAQLRDLKVHAEVYDANFGKDRLIGRVEVDLNAMVRSRNEYVVAEKWYRMADAKNRFAGDLRLEMQLKRVFPGALNPAAPAPHHHPAPVNAQVDSYGYTSQSIYPAAPAYGQPPPPGPSYAPPPTAFYGAPAGQPIQPPHASSNNPASFGGYPSVQQYGQQSAPPAGYPNSNPPPHQPPPPPPTGPYGGPPASQPSGPFAFPYGQAAPCVSAPNPPSSTYYPPYR